MRRRDFIQVTAGSIATWPLAARAQQAALPVVGLVNPRSPEASARHAAAFRNWAGPSQNHGGGLSAKTAMRCGDSPSTA
jgi:hypothetical protein